MTIGVEYLNSLLEENRDEGIYRCKREMFTDQSGAFRVLSWLSVRQPES